MLVVVPKRQTTNMAAMAPKLIPRLVITPSSPKVKSLPFHSVEIYGKFLLLTFYVKLIFGEIGANKADAGDRFDTFKSPPVH